MKRLCFLLTVPLCVLLSCQKETASDNLPYQPSGQIRFVIESVNSRVQVATADNIRSMAMFSYKDNTEFNIATDLPNHNFNERLSRTASSGSGEWVYDNPSKGKWDKDMLFHSFFAFSPFEAEDWTVTSSPNETGFPRASYTVSEDITRQADLLYAAKLNTLHYYMGNRPVPLNFRHALSKIDFKASLTPEYAALSHSVKVKEIRFSGLYHSGDARFDMAADGPLPEWSFTGKTAAPYTASVTNGALLPDAVLSTTARTIGTSPQFLLPQPIGNRPDGHAPVLKVAYEVTPDNASPTDEFIKEYELVAAGLPTRWESGKGYTYALAYDGSGQPYGLTCVVTDWNDREVAGNPAGTYLHLSELKALPAPEQPFPVYYTTDATTVSASSANEAIATVTVDAAANRVLIHHVAFGSTTITVRAGHLTQQITTAVPPPYLTVEGKRIQISRNRNLETSRAWNLGMGLPAEYGVKKLWGKGFMGNEPTGCNIYTENGETPGPHNRWRMPTLKELLAIYTKRDYLATHWPGTLNARGGWYWSSEDNTQVEKFGSHTYQPGEAALMLDFSQIATPPKLYHFYKKEKTTCFERCVRDL